MLGVPCRDETATDKTVTTAAVAEAEIVLSRAVPTEVAAVQGVMLRMV